MTTEQRLAGSVAPSRHAVQRFREHHRRAGIGDVQLAVGVGEWIEEQTALFLAGRLRRRGREASVYVLAPDRRGMFVLVRVAPHSWKVVTYLRFEASQVEFATSHWPCRSLPTRAPEPTNTHTDSKEAA